MPPRIDTTRISDDLAAHGLILRGGFVFGEADRRPQGPSGSPARSVLLVGQAGDGAWPHFRAWLAKQNPPPSDPLDSWSRHVIGTIARDHRAVAVSPSDRPYLPFQQWAMRAEGLDASPLGILAHPVWGVWHAYRGALLLDEDAGEETLRAANHPCDACLGKPCLSACPVEAYAQGGFDHAACLAHVRSPGGRDCMERGCRARNACPVGETFRYPPEMQAFHMTAYAGQV